MDEVARFGYPLRSGSDQFARDEQPADEITPQRDEQNTLKDSQQTFLYFFAKIQSFLGLSLC